MISFRTKSETGASVAMIAAVLVMVGSVVFFYMPKPKVAGRSRAQAELQSRVTKMETDEANSKALVASQVWTLPIEEIGPKALESVTAYAQKEKIKLVAFRPQKVVEVNSLNQLPMLISLEGPYPGIMKFIKDLEDPKLRLATTVVQITSTDPNSDKTSATIGVAAYRQLDTKTPTTEKSNATKKEN